MRSSGVTLLAWMDVRDVIQDRLKSLRPIVSLRLQGFDSASHGRRVHTASKLKVWTAY